MNQLRAIVVEVGRRHGDDVVRADDRDDTGELWTNVDLCVRCSGLVIAILEDIERRDCDANVMVELGSALGFERRCLLLVEERLPRVPAVLRHRFARHFDVHTLPQRAHTRRGR